MKCKDCRYYTADPHNKDDTEEAGTCRRDPPQWMRANGHDAARWPDVRGNEIPCGEFKKKKPAA